MIYIFKIIYFYNTTIFLESTHGDLFKSVVAHRYTSMHTGKVCMWSSVPYILYGGKEGVGTRIFEESHPHSDKDRSNYPLSDSLWIYKYRWCCLKENKF